MKRFLVTGGAGFIGSHLVKELVRRGESVRVLDDVSTGDSENLAGVEPEIEFVKGSVDDPEMVAKSMEGIEQVFHQAAMPSVQRSVENPVRSHSINLTGTLLLLEAACRAKVKRFVYASSSSVYGESEQLPKVETMATSPQSPYAVGKLGGELYCRVFHRLHGLETVSLRYFNVFGPGQSVRSAYAAVIPRFVSALQKGESPIIYGDGHQSRDFTYIDNVVAANLAAGCADSQVAGESFNVACGERFTLLDLLREIEEITGLKAKPKFESPRQGDIRDSLADIGKARKMLGYEPSISFHEGLSRMMQSMKASRA